MAKSTSSSTTSNARKIASEGKNVRDRVRDLTVRSLRGDVGRKDLSKVVDQVLEGAKQGVHDAVPQSQKNVLKQVLDGLGEAASVAAKTGAGAVRDARTRGTTIAKKDAVAAAKQVSEAHDQFLNAAGKFARRLSGEVREEMEDLVARARRAGPKIRSAAGDAAKAADGRLLELGGESVRAGTRLARNAIGGLMMATGGLLEGLAESIKPAAASGTGAAKSPVKPAKTAAKKGTRPKPKSAKRASKSGR